MGGGDLNFPQDMGLGGPNPAQFQQPLPQQPVPQQQPSGAKRRSSSLSSGSLSPISKQKTNVNNGTTSSFGGVFPPILDNNDNNHHQPQPITSSTKSKAPAAARKENKKRAKSFPEKLMQSMMEYADEEAVAWLPDGKSFVIVNPDLFCDEVLNKVFKESKYASFVRKLHRWGFVRLTSGTGTDCFHHPTFQRNRKELAAKISCQPRGDKDKPDRASSERNVKPPSLAGVEKFIRAKVVAAAASAAATADESMLLKAEDNDNDDDDDDDDDEDDDDLSGDDNGGDTEL
jgi:hypothetical protein